MKKARKLPEVLTPAEQARLLGEAQEDATPSELRDLALISVMLTAGLRASEVLALTDRDIEWDRSRLWVRQGKGGKDRSLWLPDETLLFLRRWLAHRPLERPFSNQPGPSSKQYVFTSLDGRRRLGGRWLRYLVKEWARRAGIGKNVHLHTLRHSFAANLLRQTGNVFTVMRALGHEDLATTQIYLSIEDAELEAAMKQQRIGESR